MTLSLGPGLASPSVTARCRGLRIPFGFVLLTDIDGAPLRDANGVLILEKI